MREQYGKALDEHRDNYHFVVTQIWKATGAVEWPNNVLAAQLRVLSPCQAPGCAAAGPRHGPRQPAHDLQALPRDRNARRGRAVLADFSARAGRERRTDGASVCLKKLLERAHRIATEGVPLWTRPARPALFFEEFLKLEPGVQCRRRPASEPIGDQLPRDSEHPGEFCAPSILLVTPFPKLTNELLGF